MLNDAYLSTLSTKVLELFDKHERLTIAEMVELTDANKNTVKVRFRELAESGRIQRYGKGRATWHGRI